jgi:hypothetical protein
VSKSKIDLGALWTSPGYRKRHKALVNSIIVSCRKTWNLRALTLLDSHTQKIAKSDLEFIRAMACNKKRPSKPDLARLAAIATELGLD